MIVSRQEKKSFKEKGPILQIGPLNASRCLLMPPCAAPDRIGPEQRKASSYASGASGINPGLCRHPACCCYCG
jgi:hypothetical protein